MIGEAMERLAKESSVCGLKKLQQGRLFTRVEDALSCFGHTAPEH